MAMVPGQRATHRNGRKTHCKHGHAFDEGNTYITKAGARICRACHTARQKQYYRDPATKQAVIERGARWRKSNPERFRFFVSRWQRENQAWVDKIKTDSGCKGCGERHPACLDFHHRDAGAKEINISNYVKRWGPERLRAEIAKCDVLCSNCHRKLHYDSRQTALEGT